MSLYTAQLFCRWSSYLWNKMIFPPPALLSEFSYRPTFYFNAGISARNSSATRFAAGPSSGQKAVSCAGVLQLLQMFLLLFHCPGYERVGALTALELSAGEYRAKNPEITQIYNPLSDIFICLFKVCEFSEKVDALRTHKFLAWELEFAQQFSSAEKTPSFQLVGLNYKTQKERRGRRVGSRERHGERESERETEKQKESVRKSAAYPNSIQLQNLVSSLSFDYLLISTGGEAERTSDTGKASGKWHPGCAFASRRRTVRSPADPTPATSSWALLLLPAQLSAQRRPLGGAVASLEPVCVRVRVPSACCANRWSFARKWSPVFICSLYF